MSIGKRFLSAVIADGSIKAFLQYGTIKHLFKANEEAAFAFVAEHVKKFGALPKLETVEAHTGETLIGHQEPADYYFELLEKRQIELRLKQGGKAMADALLPENKDPHAALKVMAETVMELMAARSTKQMTDFRDAYEMIIGDYASKWAGSAEGGLKFGWPTLDEMSGGLGKGDMISFVGRPQQGKTFQMLYGAHHGWAKAAENHDPSADQSRMFVSMEMAVLQIQQRLAAIQTHVPMFQLKHATLPTIQLKQLKSGLTEIKGYGAPFYIVDGNLTATVEDIWSLARQLKPAAIFIDGAYLVKHPKERDRFKRVAENAELIKSELASIAPTVCSWQFAKTAAKKNKKQGEKPDLEDIGYTDAIAQVSSLVLGLFEEDTAESVKNRKVEILKGRSGETGSFTTRWDFDRMLFDEVVTTPLEDLQIS